MGQSYKLLDGACGGFSNYLIAINGIPIKDICTYILLERKDEEALFKFRTPNGMEKTVRLKRTN